MKNQPISIKQKRVIRKAVSKLSCVVFLLFTDGGGCFVIVLLRGHRDE